MTQITSLGNYLEQTLQDTAILVAIESKTSWQVKTFWPRNLSPKLQIWQPLVGRHKHVANINVFST